VAAATPNVVNFVTSPWSNAILINKNNDQLVSFSPFFAFSASAAAYASYAAANLASSIAFPHN
jgi:hypothetical protein